MSSVMRIGSVCIRVIGVDLLNAIFRSAFAHDTPHRPHLRLHGVGGHQLQPSIRFGVLQGKVNIVLYIAQVVKPVLLPVI